MTSSPDRILDALEATLGVVACSSPRSRAASRSALALAEALEQHEETVRQEERAFEALAAASVARARHREWMLLAVHYAEKLQVHRAASSRRGWVQEPGACRVAARRCSSGWSDALAPRARTEPAPPVLAASGRALDA